MSDKVKYIDKSSEQIKAWIIYKNIWTVRKKDFVYIEGLQWDNLPINKKTLDLVFFIMSGGEIKPIKIMKFENGYKVLDGRHRIAAFKLLDKKMILAKYYEPK